MLEGVGLILLNPVGHVLVIKELVAKPQMEKFAGMYSIPFETIHDGEAHEAALLRLIDEELGGIGKVISPTFFRSFTIKDTIGHVFEARTEHDADAFSSKSDDVVVVGWVDPQVLGKMYVRRETPPILSAYMAQTMQQKLRSG